MHSYKVITVRTLPSGKQLPVKFYCFATSFREASSIIANQTSYRVFSISRL